MTQLFIAFVDGTAEEVVLEWPGLWEPLEHHQMAGEAALASGESLEPMIGDRVIGVRSRLPIVLILLGLAYGDLVDQGKSFVGPATHSLLG
jgi:hypothetical protein